MTDPPMKPSRRPSDQDIGERVNRLRIIGLGVGGCIVLSVLVALYLHQTRRIRLPAMLGIALLGAGVGYSRGRGRWLPGASAAGAFAHLVPAPATLPPAPSYSYQ